MLVKKTVAIIIALVTILSLVLSACGGGAKAQPITLRIGWAGSIRRLRRGFVADDDSLAVEVIAAAMNGTHNFLGQKHTSRYLKSGEVLLTRLAERGTWEMWDNCGRKGMAERAQAEAERILREHQVPPLEAIQEKELEALMAAAESELVKR